LPRRGRVSMSQRVDGQQRAQAIGLSHCRRPIITSVSVTVCHPTLYFVRRVPRFCPHGSASPSRTSCRRSHPAGGSPIRAVFSGSCRPPVPTW